MKKLFPESKVSRKGLVEFLDKKGFYVVLIICIVIVGATAVFVTTNNISPSNTGFDTEKIIPDEISAGMASSMSKPEPGNVANASSTSTTDVMGVANVPSQEVKAAAANSETKPAAQKASPTPAATKPADTKSTSAAKAQDFAVPVFGSISLEYAQDKLVYSKTLDEWSTHGGIDIAADRGTQVKAAADGVVSEIKNDPRLGIMVILDHQNGIKTIYANLASDEMVTTNQRVKQGDVIGSVGNTAVFESAEPPHLHFEVWKNNIPVNPMDYIPKK